MRFGVLTYGNLLVDHRELAHYWEQSEEDVLYDEPSCYVATEYLPGGGWVAHGEYHFCGVEDLVIL